MVRLLSRVDSQVALQSLKVPETGATDFTGIGLLASVDEHVGTEVGHLRRRAKSEVRGSAGVGYRHAAASQRHPGLGSFPTPSAHLDKSGSARFALVGLLSGVNSGVGFQVGWPVELGPADVTAIGLLTCYREKGKRQATLSRGLHSPRALDFKASCPSWGHFGFPSLGRCQREASGVGHPCLPTLSYTRTSTPRPRPGSRSRW